MYISMAFAHLLGVSAVAIVSVRRGDVTRGCDGGLPCSVVGSLMSWYFIFAVIATAPVQVY